MKDELCNTCYFWVSSDSCRRYPKWEYKFNNSPGCGEWKSVDKEKKEPEVRPAATVIHKPKPKRKRRTKAELAKAGVKSRSRHIP